MGNRGAVRVDLIGTVEELTSIEPVWKDLWERCEWADLFTSFEWVLSWWTHFGHGTGPAALVVHEGNHLVGIPGRGARPHVLVVREGVEPVALVPFALVRGWWRRWPVRVLASPVNSHSLRSGFLGAGPADRPFEAILQHLRNNRDWDLMILDGMACESGISAALNEAAARHRWECRRAAAWSHAYLALEGTWEHYLGAKSANFRRTLKRSEQGLAKMGRLRVVCYEGREAATEGMRRFLEVDEQSWKAVRGESIAVHDPLKAYYCDLARTFGRRGQCEVWVLTVGGETAAAFLCFVERGILYLYKASYKDRFASSQNSPGFVLMSQLVQNAYARKRRGLDFVGRVPFLDRWATENRTFDQSVMYGRHLYPRVIRAVQGCSGSGPWSWRTLRGRLARLLKGSRAGRAGIPGREEGGHHPPPSNVVRSGDAPGSLTNGRKRYAS